MEKWKVLPSAEEDTEIVEFLSGDQIRIVAKSSIKSNPTYYDWKPLQSHGAVENVIPGVSTQVVDLVSDLNSEMISQWVDWYTKIGKPFILAEGVMKEKNILKDRFPKIKKYLERKEEGKNPKKVWKVPYRKVYGVFAKIEVKEIVHSDMEF